MLHPEISEAIIGAAMRVLNTLKPGLDEKLYERALVIELRKQGHNVEQQKQFLVRYDGHEIGTLIPDLIVDEAVIVDAKVVSDFHESHIAQMIGYLAITNLQLAVLVNFQKAKLQWKRVVRGIDESVEPRISRINTDFFLFLSVTIRVIRGFILFRF